MPDAQHATLPSGDDEVTAKHVKADEWADDLFLDPAQADGSKPGRDEADAGKRPDNGRPDRTAEAELAPSPLIEWLARAVVPRLATVGLVSLPRSQTGRPVSGRPASSHFLIRVLTGDGEPVTIAPLESHALDQYAPIHRVAGGEGQLWRIDDSLIGLVDPGSSAIATSFDAGPAGRGVVTLFRLPAQDGFRLDDLLALDELVADGHGPSQPDEGRLWPPAVLISSREILALRQLLRDLLTATTPYEVARRLARAARSFFDAPNCVVYFVAPVAANDDLDPLSNRADRHPALQLAASIGSGVALTPPWLAPEATAESGSLFASARNGPVLLVRFGDDRGWIERRQADGSVLIALPLRNEDGLVAVLGMRRTSDLTERPTITVETFAFLAGLSLDVARRRDAEHSSALGLRSELARTRLAQNALVAMIGSTGILAGLAAHASVLVPGVADGCLVYLDPAVLPEATRRKVDRTDGPASRVVSHWRTHRDPSRIAALERWVDERMAPLLTTRAGPAASGPSDGHVDALPLFVSDVSPTEAVPPSADEMGTDTAVRSLAAVPIIRDRIVIGALALVTTEHGRRYGRRDFAFIASLAEPVSQALSALMLMERPPLRPVPLTATIASSETGSVRLLAAINAQLLTAADLDDIGRVVTQTLASWRADWCVLELRDEDGTTRTIGTQADPDQVWPAHLWARMTCDGDPLRGPSHVMRTGQSDLSPTITWAGVNPETGTPNTWPAGARFPNSSLSVAIRDEGQIIGVITCLRTDRNDPFDLGDLAVAETVAATTDDAVASFRRWQRERAESARLRRLADQHAQVIRQMADAVIAVDHSGTIVYVNDAARALHASDDLSGTISDYVQRYQPIEIEGQPYTAESFPLAMALASGLPARGLWQMRSDAERIVLVGNAAPLRDERGMVIGGVLSIHNATLEFERAQIRQHQLLELAEELQSPMTSIKGWVQYLGQRSESPIDRTTEARALDAITAQTRTVQRLVEQITTTARRQSVGDDDERGHPGDASM